MKNSGNNKNLLVDINYFKRIGEKFLESAFLLANQEKFENHIYAFNLLIIQAMENLGKSVVALRILINSGKNEEKKIREEIDKELIEINHNLDKIFDKLPEIKNVLNIDKIEKHNSQFLNEYRIKFKDNQYQEPIRIKSLESARYGSFSHSKDVVSTNYDKNDVLKFLNKYKIEVDKLYKDLKPY